MAETVEYVVRIVGLGGSDEDKKEKEKPSALTSGLEGLQKALHPIQTLTKVNKDDSSFIMGAKQIAKAGINFLETEIPLGLNRYFKLSEDYKSQNYLSNVMNNINRTKGLATSVVGGTMTGAKAGPWGAVIGAVVGGISNIGTQLISWNDKIANFNSSMNATRVETNFRAKRAGLYDGGKGTEN